MTEILSGNVQVLVDGVDRFLNGRVGHGDLVLVQDAGRI